MDDIIGRWASGDAAARLQLPEAPFRARLAGADEKLHCDSKADFSKARSEYEKEREA